MLRAFSQTASGLGLMVGVIVGAGMFALPYVVMRAGLFWGMVHVILAFSILTSIHLLYGAVVRITPGKHRLPGYAKKYLGFWAEKLAFLSAFGGFYGALLVYGILGGSFLSRILPGAPDANGLTFIFFAAGAGILLFQLQRVGKINFFLTFLLVIFVAALAGFAFSHIRTVQLPAMRNASWFLPYGVFLFAFAGASAVPDAAELFRKGNGEKKAFRRVLVLATIIPLVVYALFVATVLGVSGADTSPEAIFGLESALGHRAVFIGSLVGLLAVFTSFLALGLDLKNMFRYDMKFPPHVAWGAVITVPVVLFLLGINDFIRVIGFVGAGAIGIDGVLILLMSYRLRQAHLLLHATLIIALVAGVVFEVLMLFGILIV
jgi:tyrosine-specific transport protein